MINWHKSSVFKPLWLVSLFLVSLLTDTVSVQATESPFQLSIETDDNDPRIALFVVTAAEKQFWASLRDADEAQFHRVFSLKRESKSDVKLPAMLGRYQRKGRRLELKPTFPLVHGGRYTAVFDPADLINTTRNKAQRLTKTYAIPLPDSKPPRVTAVYPSSDRLPANHLKFYIQFSEPMQQGDIFEHFSLFNKTQNREVPRPFRHTELWSRDGKQLTLWFHPGRQKVGVNLNVELGAILNEGQEYELRISPQWAALSGHSLGKEAKKTFTAVAMDERQPDFYKWKLNQPEVGTRAPLVYQFNESLDYALLLSQLTLRDVNKKPVPGTVEVAENETMWRFIPDQPWQAGWYQLTVGEVIEDLAGNSLARPFAIDLSQQQTPSKLDDGSYTMVFSIK